MLYCDKETAKLFRTTSLAIIAGVMAIYALALISFNTGAVTPTRMVAVEVVGKLPAEAAGGGYVTVRGASLPSLKVRYINQDGVEHIDTVVVEPVRFARTNIGDRMAVEIPVPR